MTVEGPVPTIGQSGVSTLRLDLGPLARLKAHQEFALEEPWDPMEVGGETVAFAGPVRAQGTVERIHAGARIQGTAGVRIRLRCGRCLDPYAEDLDIPFDLFLSETARADGERGDDWDEAEAMPYREQVDLTPMIEESVILALPVRPLCREDCPGLCPVCGQRRDRGCTCEGARGDEALGRLGVMLLEAERHRRNGSSAGSARKAETHRDREVRGPEKESRVRNGNEQGRHTSVRKGT